MRHDVLTPDAACADPRRLLLAALLLLSAVAAARDTRDLALPPTYDEYLREEVYEDAERWRDPAPRDEYRWREPEPAQQQGRARFGFDAEDEVYRARREMRSHS